MDSVIQILKDTFSLLALPKMTFIDIVEIFIIAFSLYHIIFWVKKTRAWTLLKGIVVLSLIYLVAYFLDMSVIIWLFNKGLAIGLTALAVVFQPELRKALEELGRKNIVTSIIPFDDSKDKKDRFSDKTITEIVKATVELAKAKTGALIILEQDISLAEYERTGITIDSAISSQLLINIFEHNTPLHDGAVIVRGNRVVAATCYLPLTDNVNLSKALGTRHRAGVGISEATDSLTIIVSEETGKVSVAFGGELIHDIDADSLKNKLEYIRRKTIDVKSFKIWRGRLKHEREDI